MADLNFDAFAGVIGTTGGDLGAQDVLHAGWLPPAERTAEGNAEHARIVGESPPFAVVGAFPRATENKAFLWDAAKLSNNGEHFRTFYQQTGSCVGNGGGNAVWYLSAVEVVRLHDRERVLLPFWLLSYGKSRQYAGLRGRGEGSFGSAFAEAARKDGFVPASAEGLPPWEDRGGITWGRDAELDWSDGARVSEAWLEKSRKHLIQTTAQVRSADQMRDALQNYYPVTIASDWGGRMRCPVVEGVLLNERRTTWMHQMCVVGWWDHPKLGEIFYVLNSWGDAAHGDDPAGGPPGGFWVKAREIDSITAQGDSWAFSQFNGFPAQELDFGAF